MSNEKSASALFLLDYGQKTIFGNIFAQIGSIFCHKNLHISEKSCTFAAKNVTAGTDSVKKRWHIAYKKAFALLTKWKTK